MKAVAHLKKSDPVLRKIIERIGPCRMGARPAEFGSLARSIVYQQLNGKAAGKIFERLVAAAGEPLTPEGVLALTDAQMSGAGLSKQKSSYLRDLAEKTVAGALDFSRLAEMCDQDVVEHLTQVKGVGVWTAHMFLMFALNRQNILPTGDFGVRMAMFKHYLDVKREQSVKKAVTGKKKGSTKRAVKRKITLPTPAQMEKIAKSWEPYRSVACWYLWRSIDTKTP
jgi:DNA-3-methyladenine glycosylase II